MDELLTRQEAAKLLGIQPQTLAAWASNRRYVIPFIKVGRSVRYRRSDVLEWMKRQTVGSFADADAAQAGA